MLTVVVSSQQLNIAGHSLEVVQTLLWYINRRVLNYRAAANRGIYATWAEIYILNLCSLLVSCYRLYIFLIRQQIFATLLVCWLVW